MRAWGNVQTRAFTNLLLQRVKEVHEKFITVHTGGAGIHPSKLDLHRAEDLEP